MSVFDEVKVIPTMCRNHYFRKDRECFRTCPTKLSKKELEDLYFTLLDNNLKLKSTLNSREETIKLLSTKVHRMTMLQKNMLKEPKDCCAHTKALVKHQKESIEDLKIVKEQMKEKIRMLNMHLCSAKQLSKSSTGPVMCCTKCFVPLSGKNSSRSMINTKRSEVLRSRTVSTNCLDRENISTKTVDTQTDINVKENQNPEGLCRENKCNVLKEELEQKIIDLQKELANSHETYSNQTDSLNVEINKLNSDNQRLRAEFVARQFDVQQSVQLADKLSNRLRAAEARSGELAIQLSVEKLKVSELETHARVVDTTHALTKAIGDQLYITNKCTIQPATPIEVSSSLFPYHAQIWDKTSSLLEVSHKSVSSDVSSPKGEIKMFDDSGYADQTQDEDSQQNLQHSNNELIKKISLLQDQLSALETSDDKDTESSTHVKTYSKELTQHEEKDQIKDQPAENIVAPYDTMARSVMFDNSLHHNQKAKIAKASGSKEIDKNLEVDSDPDTDISNRSYTIEKHDSMKSAENPSTKKMNEKIVVTKFKQLIRVSKENVSKQSNGTEYRIAESADTKNDTTVQTRRISKNKHSKNITKDEMKAENFKSNKSKHVFNNSNDLQSELKANDDKNTSASTDKTNIIKAPSEADKCVECASRIETQMHNHPDTIRAPSANRHRSHTFSKGSSPDDDTDNDISSLTDLPCVKERATSEERSPGEKRTTTTHSDSCSDFDYGSLSEGELPQVRKDRTMSKGETRETPAHLPSGGVQGMQDTLQAIGDEIKRCHRLLRTQPPQVTHQMLM